MIVVDHTPEAGCWVSGLSFAAGAAFLPAAGWHWLDPIGWWHLPPTNPHRSDGYAVVDTTLATITAAGFDAVAVLHPRQLHQPRSTPQFGWDRH